MDELNNSKQIDLIKYPLITDKTTRLLNNNQYTFLVDPKLSKPQIKQTLELIFDIKIIKINTSYLPFKNHRVGKYIGKKPQYKKAIVKLAEGCTINVFSEP